LYYIIVHSGEDHSRFLLISGSGGGNFPIPSFGFPDFRPPLSSMLRLDMEQVALRVTFDDENVYFYILKLDIQKSV